MTLVSIDDRDTINNYHGIHSSIVDYKEYLQRLQIENPLCNIIYLGGSKFKLEFPTIECTGSDIDTLFRIPFAHGLKQMEIKHTDSNMVDSTDELTYSVAHMFKNLWIVLLLIADSTASDILDQYVDYDYNESQYRFISNTTNLDKILMNVIVEIKGM